MAIDDDLRAIVKFQLQHAARFHFKIKVAAARIQRLFQAGQGRFGQVIELVLIHRKTPHLC